MYHIYKKTVKSGGKDVQRWYYWYNDALTNKRVSKVCKDCRTKQQAALYVSQLDKPVQGNDFTVKSLAKDMYIPGSEYQNLLNSLGRTISQRSQLLYARALKSVVDDFGSCRLRDLSIKKIIDCLTQKDRSASWKNIYLHVVHELYVYANYCGANICEPKLPSFRKHAKKSDVFTLDELSLLLNTENFSAQVYYYFFLLTLSSGMRSGEARAFRPCQIMKETRSIVIDGFLDNKNNRTGYCKTGSDENLRWRVVPLPLFVFEKITAYIGQTKCPENDLLFRIDGKPIQASDTSRQIRAAMKKAGIKADGRKLTCHSLRYTYITNMRSFLSGEDVRKIAGHNSMEMTEYYTRASMEAAAIAIQPMLEVVDKFFKKIPKSTENP